MSMRNAVPRRWLALPPIVVAIALGAAAGASGDPLPEGCDKVQGTVICESQPGGSGDAASGQDSSSKTETQKGSFQSSHPTCTFPPPHGKCS